MAWRMKGTYVASCSCQLICPCPVDGPPTGPEGVCRGSAVFHVAEGNLNGTDLGGAVFAFYNEFPSNITAGNWKVGVVVDEGASDQQFDALQRILGGQEGGPFGDFVPLIGEMVGFERGRVTFSDGDNPRASVEGKTEIGFEPSTGPTGGVTTVRNAMFGFAPEYKVGKGTGHSNAFGITYEPTYGESAEYEYTSETADIHPRA